MSVWTQLLVAAVLVGFGCGPTNETGGLSASQGDLERTRPCPPGRHPCGRICPCGLDDEGECLPCVCSAPNPTSQGFSCPDGATDAVWACGVDKGARQCMTAAGWVDVGADCYQHRTGSTCSIAEYAACAGRSTFCDASGHIIELMCICSVPPTRGWVDHGAGCYQRSTAVACL
jgi:hypothetical protein